MSFKQRVVAPPKYYAIDNGMRRANSPQTTPDKGRRLENAVALELLRRRLEPCYTRERKHFPYMREDFCRKARKDWPPRTRSGT